MQWGRGREALKLHRTTVGIVPIVGPQYRATDTGMRLSPEPYQTDDSGSRSGTEPQRSSSILAGEVARESFGVVVVMAGRG
jgi:hypothetical protein